jgi:hypothetical protein
MLTGASWRGEEPFAAIIRGTTDPAKVDKRVQMVPRSAV